MQEFGDFAKIDLEKLLRGMDDQSVRLERFQRDLGTYVGHAQDEAGMVTVAYDHRGIRDLELHPKAMRLASADLADLIKTAVADATADFQEQLNTAVREMFGDGDDSMRFADDPAAALRKMKEAEAIHGEAFTDVMDRLDQIRRRLDL